MTPAQARLKSLQSNIDNGKHQLKAERERQQQQKERESALKTRIGAKQFSKPSQPSALLSK